MITKETQRLVDLANQAKSACEDVERTSANIGRPLDNDDYRRVHRARMTHEGARWRALVALGEEAGLR